MDFNKAIVAGRLTRDPESKVMPSGVSVTSFSVASNRTRIKDGQKQEEAEYHNVVVFDKQAETCARYLHRGDTALVEGRLQTRSWDKDGQKQYRTEIVADRVQFGAKSGDHQEEERGRETAPAPATIPPTESAKSVVPPYPYPEINPEDIPF